jgi:hypothetical protein
VIVTTPGESRAYTAAAVLEAELVDVVDVGSAVLADAVAAP